MPPQGGASTQRQPRPVGAAAGGPPRAAGYLGALLAVLQQDARAGFAAFGFAAAAAVPAPLLPASKMPPIPVVQPPPAPPTPRVLQASCHHEQQPRPQQQQLQQPLQQVAAEVAPSGPAALQLYHRSDRSSQAIRCIEEFEATGMGALLALPSHLPLVATCWKPSHACHGSPPSGWATAMGRCIRRCFGSQIAACGGVATCETRLSCCWQTAA